MKFTNHSHHKSTSVQIFAANLSAIEYIIGFRKRHPKVFKVIITIVIVIATAAVIFFTTFLILGAVISAKEAPQESYSISATQNIRLESCTIISSSQLQIETYLEVNFTTLAFKLEYIDINGNVFHSDFANFENLSAGANTLTVNMDNGIDLTTCEVRVTVF